MHTQSGSWNGISYWRALVVTRISFKHGATTSNWGGRGTAGDSNGGFSSLSLLRRAPRRHASYVIEKCERAHARGNYMVFYEASEKGSKGKRWKSGAYEERRR